MKQIIGLLIMLSLLLAQDTTVVDTTWQKELSGSLGFSQAQFDNWSAGGENNLAHQLDLGGKLINNRKNFTWINTGKVAFGNTKIGDTDSKKTIDEIRVESMLTHLGRYQLDPYFSVKGETQIAPGYSYSEDLKTQVSAFLDPAYFTQSIGFIYVPKNELSVRFGAAIKETITKDYPTPYADDSDTEEIETTKIEPGIESVITFSKNLNEATSINSTIDLFNNLKGFEATDIRWDTNITTRIAKYFNIKFSLKLFYDRDISLKRQLNQSLLLGVSYIAL